MDAAASGVRGDGRAGLAREPSPSRRRPAIAAYGKTVWSWHPLLVSSSRKACRPNRARTCRSFADDGDKTNSSPGRARHKPSNHCAGKVGCPGCYLYARVRILLHFLHTRPRVPASTRPSLRPLISRAEISSATRTHGAAGPLMPVSGIGIAAASGITGSGRRGRRILVPVRL